MVVKINKNEWIVTTADESVIWIQKFGAGPTGSKGEGKNEGRWS